MLPSYTLALGKTEAVEKLMNFVNTQDQTRAAIMKKLEDNDFAIGDDNTFKTEREILEKQKGGE